MKKIIVFLGIVLVFLVGYTGFNWLRQGEVKKVKKQPLVKPSSELATTELNLITLYDNYQSDPNLETGHGFSCLAKSKDQTILFDTGADSLTLLSNMEKLGINPQEIDIIVLSHIHSDHVDGLWGLLEKNKDVKVYLPASFPDSFREKIKSYGANYQDVKSSIQIKEGIYSTGELGTFIKEQALVVKTEKGLVVLTGCAHPGVVSMVRKAKEVGGDKIHLVMGGFHLGGMPDSEIEEIIKDLKQLGVDKVAPCHCSGDRARQLFQIRFGENYFENGVGKEINL